MPRLFLLLASVLFVTACSSTAAPAKTTGAATADAKGDTSTPLAHTFPKGFIWGTAIAGFQVDMGCPTLPASECNDTKSDWYQWVTDPSLKADSSEYIVGDPVEQGPGFWEMYGKDMDHAKNDLHNTGLRTSIEWSRLFPDAKAESAKSVEELATMVDAKAVAHYHAIFKAAKDHGLTLLVTLNHYTLPLWMHDGKDCHDNGVTGPSACKINGWVNKDRIVPAIALYAGFCAKEFGGEVDLWGTINEPFAVVLAGYMMPGKDRSNPPGLTLEVDTAISVAFNMMEAHAKMYDAVHQYDTVDVDGDGKAARVGVVANLAAVAPSDPTKQLDIDKTPHLDYVYHRVFLNAVIKGDLDRNLDGTAEEHRADMVDKMDFIGVNYYTQIKCKGQAGPMFPQYPMFDFMPDTSSITNGIYAPGIGEVVKLANSYGKPAIITENGTSADKATSTEGYLKPHLTALWQAIQDGGQVEGYFYWSLMDNYEWNHGLYDWKMGMFSYDPTTKELIGSPLAVGYGKIATDNGF